MFQISTKSMIKHTPIYSICLRILTHCIASQTQILNSGTVPSSMTFFHTRTWSRCTAPINSTGQNSRLLSFRRLSSLPLSSPGPMDLPGEKISKLCLRIKKTGTGRYYMVLLLATVSEIFWSSWWGYNIYIHLQHNARSPSPHPRLRPLEQAGLEESRPEGQAVLQSAAILMWNLVETNAYKCPFTEFQGCNSFGPVNGVLGPRVSVCIHIHQDMLTLSSGLLVTNPPSNFIKQLPVMLCAHSTSPNTKHENHGKTQFLS